MYRKDNDNLRIRHSSESLRNNLGQILNDFTFKEGDSDYRGFHFDGRNKAGTDFTVEQLHSHEAQVPKEGYNVDLYVSGENKDDVEEVHSKLMHFLLTEKVS